MALDVGEACTDRGSANAAGYTVVSEGNPAGEAADCDHIDVWMANVTGGTNIQVASFYSTNGTTFATREYDDSITVASGDNDLDAPGDFTAIAFHVGDHIGCCADGQVERDTSGGSGFYYVSYDAIPNEQSYSTASGYVQSLYGTGTEAGTSIDVNDSLNISEAITTRLSDLARSVYDTLNVSDIPTVSVISLGLDIDIYDLLNISESITSGLSDLSTSPYDTLNISESVTNALSDLGISLSDLLNISENITLTSANLGGINIADNLTVAEAVSFFESIGLNVYDTLNVSESITGSLSDLTASLYDTLNISEDVSIQSVFVLTLNVYDSLNISEDTTTEIVLLLTLNVYDTLNVSEYIHPKVIIMLTEGSTRSTTFTEGTARTTTFTEATARETSFKEAN